MTLTQAYLKSILHYDPLTGVFTRRLTAGNAKTGDVNRYVATNGYSVIGINGKQYKAHRLAFLYMDGVIPENQVDHINGIRHDNRYENLRKTTNQENQRNARIRIDNSSGLTGVRWNKFARKWQAWIRVDGKDIYLGLFADWFDAACARKSAQNLHGFHPNHGRIC